MKKTVKSRAVVTNKRILLACASAVRSLEMPFNTVKPSPARPKDLRDYNKAKRLLWDILERNGMTIDCTSNRLTKAL